jgi:DNA-binding response OmpR family regulator
MDESASAKTILLIDDEPNRAQLIETALQSAEHRVLTIAGNQTLDFLLR